MDTPQSKSSNATRAGIAGVGLAALAIACCAGLPLLIAVAGGIGATALIGARTGMVTLIAVGVGALVIARARRRRCQPSLASRSRTQRAQTHPTR